MAFLGVLGFIAVGVVLAANAASSYATETFQSATNVLNGGCRSEGLLIQFEEELLLFGDDTTDTVPFEVRCTGRHELVLVSGDPGHRAGTQTWQTEERWYLEFLDAGGSVVATSRSTDDLPDDQTISRTVASVELTGAEVAVRARHSGTPGAINSVEVLGAAVLPPPSEIPCGDGFTTLDFNGPPLLSGQSESVVLDNDVHCHCGQHWVVAVGQDLRHQSGYQPNQLAEQWRLDVSTADGDLIDSTESTPDLADERWALVSLLSLEIGEVEGDLTFTAVNTSSSAPNSIDPVLAVIVNK